VIPNWNDRKAQLRDLHRNVAYSRYETSSPFEPVGFNFEETSKMVATVNKQFGQFHEAQCQELTQGLAQMDPSISGRVPLGQFYAKRTVGYWNLVESADYLRSLGAIDDSAGAGLRVIIPNYAGSMSNCDAPSQFYSICCVSEGPSLLNQIEVSVQAPVARPQQILELVSNLPSSTIAAPRNLSSALVSALNDVAKAHDGQIPLHSRLFAQWLHFAYPYEVPYPHMSGSIKPQSPQRWSKAHGCSDDADQTEINFHMSMIQDQDDPLFEVADPMSMWTLEDEMLAGHGELHEHTSPLGSLLSFMGVIFQIAPFFLVLLGISRSLVNSVRTGMGGPQLLKKGAACVN